MQGFGRWGRAGNQFLEYLFLKAYAEKYDCVLQLPPWVGNDLFGTVDTPLSDSSSAKFLPKYREYNDPKNKRQTIPPSNGEVIGHDFEGYAQYHTSYLSNLVPSREWARSLFKPVPSIEARLVSARDQLLYESNGGNSNSSSNSGLSNIVIGLHIRRGDYGRFHFPLTPTSWFLEWLKNHCWLYSNVDRYPKLFIATEDPELVNEFALYRPHTARSLGVQLSRRPMKQYNYLSHDLKTKQAEQIDWYPDFYLLSQCHVIVGSNSTFSFCAALLGERLEEYWRASLPAADFVLTDPWDAYPLLRDDVRDFPHLAGISVKDNPYWTK